MERQRPEVSVHHITRFFKDEDEARETVSHMLEEDPTLTKGEIFRRVSEGKGMGKSHASQYTVDHKDYTLKTRRLLREKSRRI